MPSAQAQLPAFSSAGSLLLQKHHACRSGVPSLHLTLHGGSHCSSWFGSRSSSSSGIQLTHSLQAIAQKYQKRKVAVPRAQEHCSCQAKESRQDKTRPHLRSNVAPHGHFMTLIIE